jgi:acyl-CoA thioesterase
MVATADELDRLIELARQGKLGPVTGPFEQLIGYRARYDDAHGVFLELEVEERHLSHFGVAHGGVVLLLLDTVGGVAVAFRDRSLERIATISLTTSFIRAVEVGRVVATARIDHLGGAIAHVATALHAGDVDGPLLATGIAAYRLFRGEARGG